MSANSYSSSAPPIMEGWLIKALRLVYSKNPADREKLRKFYKEACENESQVSRITVAEALRESRDSIRSESMEVEPPPITSRVRVGTASAQSSVPTPLVSTCSVSTSSISTLPSTVSSQGLPSSMAPIQSTAPSSTTSKTAKRTKVAFFNIFDPASAGSTRPVNSAPPASKSATTVADSDALVIDLTESSNISQLPMPRPVTSMAPVTTTTSTPVGLTIPKSTVPLPALSMGSIDPTDNVREKTADVASLVADLACGVCGKLTQPPKLEADGKSMNPNMLVECVQCKALYHQMCHVPPLLCSTTINQQEWRCGNCCGASLTPTPSSSLSSDIAAECAPFTTPSIGARKRKGGLTSATFSPSNLKS